MVDEALSSPQLEGGERLASISKLEEIQVKRPVHKHHRLKSIMEQASIQVVSNPVLLDFLGPWTDKEFCYAAFNEDYTYFLGIY